MEKILTPIIRFCGFDKPWISSSLGEISDVKTGPFGSALHADDYVSEGHPIITTEHFKDGDIPYSKESIPQVSEEDYKRLSAYILNEDDLVFSRVGSVDINALTESCHSGWLFSSRVLRVRPNNIYADYLHYFLSTHNAKQDIINRAVGQTMPSINTTILKETNVSFPIDRSEQSKVGRLFRNTTKLLSAKSQELVVWENVKRACMERMFPREGETTPQLRFKGFTDNWVVKHLYSICSILKGQQINKSELFDAGQYYVLNGGITPSGYTSEYNTEANTISISEGGNSCGFVNLNSERFWSGGHNYTLTNLANVTTQYLYQFLKFKESEIMAMRVGSGFT